MIMLITANPTQADDRLSLSKLAKQIYVLVCIGRVPGCQMHKDGVKSASLEMRETSRRRVGVGANWDDEMLAYSWKLLIWGLAIAERAHEAHSCIHDWFGDTVPSDDSCATEDYARTTLTKFAPS